MLSRKVKPDSFYDSTRDFFIYTSVSFYYSKDKSINSSYRDINHEKIVCRHLSAMFLIYQASGTSKSERNKYRDTFSSQEKIDTEPFLKNNYYEPLAILFSEMAR